MPVPNRYNGGGPLAGVVVVDPVTGATISMPTPAADGSTPISGGNGTSAASSSNPVPVAGVSFTVLGETQYTVTASSAALPSIPATATTAIVQNNGTQGARFRYLGTTTPPTSALGQRIAANGVVTMDVGQTTLTTTRVIADAGGVGGVLDIVYGRYGA